MGSTQTATALPQLGAAQRVFGTIELLEHILLNLTLTETTRLQRVAREWQATVQGSIHLRDGDFGQAAKSEEFLVGELLPPNGGLGYHTRFKISSDPLASENMSMGSDWEKPRAVCQLHPRLRLFGVFAFPATTIFHFDVRVNEILNWPARELWENQLITQPPCTKVMSGKGYLHAARRDFGHLTLGDLHDFVAAETKRLARAPQAIIRFFTIGVVEERGRLVKEAREAERLKLDY